MDKEALLYVVYDLMTINGFQRTYRRREGDLDNLSLTETEAKDVGFTGSHICSKGSFYEAWEKGEIQCSTRNAAHKAFAMGFGSRIVATKDHLLVNYKRGLLDGILDQLITITSTNTDRYVKVITKEVLALDPEDTSAVPALYTGFPDSEASAVDTRDIVEQMTPRSAFKFITKLGHTTTRSYVKRIFRPECVSMVYRDPKFPMVTIYPGDLVDHDIDKFDLVVTRETELEV